ncbi:uncharacterized protein [Palaemon carinicauda]|uniref:uncharacterized protein n=1 Tax=Palaemon carinicauda TaxID=392227 RepID=UPI0035B5E9D4
MKVILLMTLLTQCFIGLSSATPLRQEGLQTSPEAATGATTTSTDMGIASSISESPLDIENENPVSISASSLDIENENPVSISASSLENEIPESTGTAEIVNGTEVSIAYMAEAFVYCFAEMANITNLHRYSIEWIDPEGVSVGPWNPDKWVFSLGRGSFLPHSYLIFSDFSLMSAGNYSCLLRLDDNLIASSSINIQIKDLDL